MTQEERSAFASLKFTIGNIEDWDTLPEPLHNHIAESDAQMQPFVAQVIMPEGSAGGPLYMLWYENSNRAAFADGDKVVWTYANDRHDAIRRFATGDLQDQFVETPGR